MARSGYHPPRKEVDQRVEFAMKLLSQGITKSQIKRKLRAEWKCTARTVENYLARARATFLAQSGKSKQMHMAEAYANLKSVINDPNVSHGDKIAAQRELNRMLGLYSPIKVAQTDSKGRDIEQDLDARRQRVADAINELRGPSDN